MKKVIALIIVLLVALSAAAVALVGFDTKSRNSRLALQAMNSGDYDRALRLYTFSIEHGEADSEDERIYSIISAYVDANRCLKNEEFAEGLDILDKCRYDYNSLSISSDMNKLYSSLSDGKYADERIRALTGIINAGDYERARSIVEDINQMNLTSAQQERLYSLSRTITSNTSSQEHTAIIYYVSRKGGTTMYFEADDESDVLCEVSAGEAVEVLSVAKNGFFEVFYDDLAGYIKSSHLSSDRKNYDDEDDQSKDELKDKNKDSDEDKKSDKDKDTDKNENKTESDNKSDDKDTTSRVEAVSKGDTLYVLTGVNLRDAPTTEGSNVLDVVPAGAEITYLGELDNGFYKIEYKGKVGYVYSDYVQN